jgi:hypothetical protein
VRLAADGITTSASDARHDERGDRVVDRARSPRPCAAGKNAAGASQVRAPARLFIYGSCVSRDAFTYVDPAQLRLQGYVARSSLASAFTGPFSIGERAARLESAFQRRMVEYDVEKRLPELLRANTYDWLLVDFLDERFDLLEFGDSVLTISAELARTGLLRERPPASRIIPRDSARHLELWHRGLRSLADLLSQIDRSESVILLRAPLASRLADDGRFGSKYSRRYIEGRNATLAEMYTAFAAHFPGAVVIEPEPDLVAGDPRITDGDQARVTTSRASIARSPTASRRSPGQRRTPEWFGVRASWSTTASMSAKTRSSE